jgi:hypothetical protein
VLAVPVLLASVWYAASREPVYRSEVVVSFAPDTGASAGSSFVRLVRRYQLVATSPDALDSAEKKAGLPAGALGDAVTVESPGDTLQLGLTVMTGTSRDTEAAAVAIAEVIVEIAERDPLVAAEFLIGPTEARDVTPLRQAVAVSAGAFLAFVPGIGVAFLLEGARPRLRTREDLAALGIPLLPSVHRRHLERWGAGGQPAKAPVGLLALRAQIRQATADPHSSTAVVVTSPTSSEADLVAALTSALTALGMPTAGDDPDDPAAGLVARPGLLTDDGGAAAAVREHGRSVLVLAAGTSRDQAQDCMQLLERLGSEVVGGVLVR